uniref:Protein LMBR1L n=1 Tax=Sus scrofa TaxID=9823 RepID=A0A8D0X8Y9_PIG
MEAADYEVLSVREQLFHERVRECIISTLLFATLYILCHIALTRFKKPAEFTTVDDEDATVNKIALELCTFTLAVALGAVLLLPFSIISNEVLLSLPRNYYIQWLNGSLIHGLWNLVFLFSNLSLIFLMPFAYFFTESEGFAGSRKGVLARVYETVVMLILLTLLVLGMVWVASAIVDNDKASRESLYDFWEYYLPYLYSCISFLGVLLLLVCTPLGLARMFSVTGKLLVKPRVRSAPCPSILQDELPAELEPNNEARATVVQCTPCRGPQPLLAPVSFTTIIWSWSPDIQSRTQGHREGLDKVAGHRVVNEGGGRNRTLEPRDERCSSGALGIREPLTVSPSLSPAPSC